MRTLVVGFDGSSQGCDALALGATFADAFGADLVVAVVDEFHPSVGEMLAGKERLADLQATLAMAAEQLGGRQYKGRAIWGSVPESLELVASDVSAAFLIVGSTHRGEIGRVVPGSVGERLLSGASCAVAIAPNGYAEHGPSGLDRIGVGIDAEEESRAALRLADETAIAAGGSLRLIAIAPLPSGLFPGRISSNAPAYARFVRDQLAGELERAMGTCSPAIEIAEVLVEGDPAEVLCKQSRELDLLVLGSRGYGPLRRVFLGGVASKVIRCASCPVLITPRSARRARPRPQETLASTVF